MAKIPRLTSVSKTSMDVPKQATESPSVAGMVARAYGDLAGTVGQIAGVYANKLYKEEAANQKSKAVNDYKNGASTIINELDQKYANTNREGYVEEYEASVSKLRLKVSEGITNNSAIKDMGPVFDNLHSQYLPSIQNKVVKESRQYYENERAKSRSAQSQNISMSGDFDSALSAYRSDLNDINSNIGIKYDEGKVPELLKDTSVWAESAIEGAVRSTNTSSMIKAKAILEGKDSRYSEMLSHMSEPKKTALLNKIDNALDNKNTSELSLLSIETKDLISNISIGNYSKEDVNSVKLRAGIIQDPVKRDLLLSNIDAAVVTDSLTKQIISGDTRDINVIVGEVVDDYKYSNPVIGSHLETTVKNSLNKFKGDMREKMLADPSSFLSKNSTLVKGFSDKITNGLFSEGGVVTPTDWKNYKESLVTNYKKFNISSTNYASPEMKQFGSRINDNISSGNYVEAAADISKVVNATGTDSYQVLRDMGIEDRFAVVADAKSNLVHSISLLTNKQDIIDSSGESLKTVKEGLVDDPYYNAYMNSGSINAIATAEAARELAALHVMYNKGKVDTSNAFKSLFGKDTTLIESNYSNVIMPEGVVKDEASKAKVGDYIDNLLTGIDSDTVIKLNIDTSGYTETFIADKIKSTGKLVYNRSTNAFNLYESSNIVKTRDGRPLSIKIEDILSSDVKKLNPFLNTMLEGRRANYAF